MDKKDILVIIILLFIAFLIRVIGISNISLYVDEWIYMLKTRLILSNNWVPVAQVFDRSPPFLSYLGAVTTVLFGGDLNTIRMISVVFGSLSVPILYLFGKAMYNRKTGLLSALFLVFSPYHILYSRVYMLEALTLFFIIMFLYFFWLSQQLKDREGITYAIIAGAMLGLAFDAKYISFFLPPAILANVLWTKRFSFKELLNKKIILTFIFAFLFFLPLVVCLFYTGVGFHGFSYFAYERFESGRRNTVAAPYMYTLSEIIVKGNEKILDVFAWGNEAGVFIPPWTYIFKFSTFLLLLITTVFYFLNFIKRNDKSSFLMISIFMLVILIFFGGNTRHYWIYSFPFYYVMFSHLAVESLEHLMRRKNLKNIFRILLISLTVMMLLFYFISSVTSPYWDKGDYHPWAKSVVDFIKNDIIRNGYEEENVLIGYIMTINKMITYQLYLDDINISTVRLLKPANDYSGKLATLDIELIERLKPTYIIVPETFYEIYFTDEIKGKIFEDYWIVFHSQDYPTGAFVLKRKNIQLLELKISTSKEGIISEYLFKESVPAVMKVGKVYKALVEVKNIGNSRTNYTIRVDSEDFIIFVEDNQRVITLDEGSARRLEFKMVPIEEHVGELPIRVDLYVEYNEENRTPTIKKADSVSDNICIIKI